MGRPGHGCQGAQALPEECKADTLGREEGLRKSPRSREDKEPVGLSQRLRTSQKHEL